MLGVYPCGRRVSSPYVRLQPPASSSGFSQSRGWEGRGIRCLSTQQVGETRSNPQPQSKPRFLPWVSPSARSPTLVWLPSAWKCVLPPRAPRSPGTRELLAVYYRRPPRSKGQRRRPTDLWSRAAFSRERKSKAGAGGGQVACPRSRISSKIPRAGGDPQTPTLPREGEQPRAAERQRGGNGVGFEVPSYPTHAVIP